MKSIRQLIETEVKLAVTELYQKENLENIQIQHTRKEVDGDYTLVVFPIAAKAKKAPQIAADEIGKQLLNQSKNIADYNVVKGFLNLNIAHSYWVDLISHLQKLTDFPVQKTDDPQKIMVEYSSPNTNKPLHLGHIRNNLLGFSVGQILKIRGHEVTLANLVNDRGIHICKSMLAWQKFGNGETPESSGIKGDHLVGKYYVAFDKSLKAQIAELIDQGIDAEKAKNEAPLMLEAQEMLRKWEANDAETVALWKKMNSWVYAGFDSTYKQLGVSFDQYYYESDTYLLGKDIIEEGLKKGVFYKKEDGSVWVDLTEDGLDEKLVLRSDGTAVYMTQDIGTAELKYKDYQINQSVYVVGNEQDYHFKVLKLILQKLKRPYADGVYHLSYGMVDLPSGKMKSREGTVVDADDLMQEMRDTAKKQTEELGKVDMLSDSEMEKLYDTLGMGALKYYLLRVDPKKRILFNPEESIDFQGNTGPFIQFNYTRIQSIARKIGKELTEIPTEYSVDQLQASEIELCRILSDFNEVLTTAEADMNPASVANYCYDLAKGFSSFYGEVSIIRENNKDLQNFRLALAHQVAKALELASSLLGMQLPSRM